MHIIVKSHQDAKNLCQKKKKGPWIVLYKANWCGHCQMLKPKWNMFLSMMKKNPKLNIAEVDSEYMSSMDDTNIMGYPTIKMYHNNKQVAEFEDERETQNLYNFAVNNMPSEPVRKPSVKKPVSRPARKTVSRKPSVKKPVRKPSVKKPVSRPARKTVSRKPSVKKSVKKPSVKKPVSRPARKTVSRKPSVKKPVRKPSVKKPVSRPARKTVSRKPSVNKDLVERMKKRRMLTQSSNKEILASLRKSLSNIQRQSMEDKKLLRSLTASK